MHTIYWRDGRLWSQVLSKGRTYHLWAYPFVGV